jgi:hypothetical protein
MTLGVDLPSGRRFKQFNMTLGVDLPSGRRFKQFNIALVFSSKLAFPA